MYITVLAVPKGGTVSGEHSITESFFHQKNSDITRETIGPPSGVLLGQAEKVSEEAEPADAARAAEGGQVAGHVLDHHRPRLPQHVRPRHRALQAAQVARLLPGRHQPLLRRPLHLRDADQDVRTRPTGETVQTFMARYLVLEPNFCPILLLLTNHYFCIGLMFSATSTRYSRKRIL